MEFVAGRAEGNYWCTTTTAGGENERASAGEGMEIVTLALNDSC